MTECTAVETDNDVQAAAAASPVVRLTRLTLVGRKIKDIESIEILEGLEYLEELDLSCNRIESLERLAALQNLTELRLSTNQIMFVDGVECLSKLQVLDISHNQVYRIPSGFGEKLPALRTFDCSYNDIYSLDDFEALPTLKQLNELRLDGNPLMNYSDRYRLYVVFHLPSIHRLDGQKVTPTERQKAIELYSPTEFELFERKFGGWQRKSVELMEQSKRGRVVSEVHSCNDCPQLQREWPFNYEPIECPDALVEQLKHTTNLLDRQELQFRLIMNKTWPQMDDESTTTREPALRMCGVGLSVRAAPPAPSASPACHSPERHDASAAGPPLPHVGSADELAADDASSSCEHNPEQEPCVHETSHKHSDGLFEPAPSAGQHTHLPHPYAIGHSAPACPDTFVRSDNPCQAEDGRSSTADNPEQRPFDDKTPQNVNQMKPERPAGEQVPPGGSQFAWTGSYLQSQVASLRQRQMDGALEGLQEQLELLVHRLTRRRLEQDAAAVQAQLAKRRSLLNEPQCHVPHARRHLHDASTTSGNFPLGNLKYDLITLREQLLLESVHLMSLAQQITNVARNGSLQATADTMQQTSGPSSDSSVSAADSTVSQNDAAVTTDEQTEDEDQQPPTDIDAVPSSEVCIVA